MKKYRNCECGHNWTDHDYDHCRQCNCLSYKPVLSEEESYETKDHGDSIYPK